MTVNRDLYDRAVQHAADLRIHEEKVNIDLGRVTRRHKSRLRKLAGAGASSTDITRELTRFKRELITFQKGALEDIANAEVLFHTNNLDKSVGDIFKVKSPNRDWLGRITKRPIRGTGNLEQQVDSILGQQNDRINRWLKDNPNASASERIAALGDTSNITDGQVGTLMATTTTQVQAESFDQVNQVNEELLAGYRFTAVLDSRTSEVCTFHDGKVYAVDDKRYVPPLHWNCRSVLVPVAKSYTDMTESESRRFDQKALAKLSDKRIADLNGLAPDVEDYSTWLRRQPVEIQMQHLGFDEDRLALFQSGHLNLDSFKTARGNFITAAELRKRTNRSVIETPGVTLKDTIGDAADDYLIEAFRIDDLITSPRARNQLVNFFIYESKNRKSPLPLTDYKGVVKETKLRNLNKSNFDPDRFEFDPITGEISRNKWIYDQDIDVLEERLVLIRNSKLLNKQQKEFIEDFVENMTNKVSTNQRSVIADNLRVTFERQLRPDTEQFGRPWENFGRVLRAEQSNAVTNVSKRLNVVQRRKADQFIRIEGLRDKNAKAAIAIQGKTRTFDDISNDLFKNQRYVDNWEKTVGKKLASRSFFHGKFPLQSYFAPPAIPGATALKKKLIKKLDKAADNIQLKPQRKWIKDTIKKWTQNPAKVAEKEIYDMAQELNTKWYQWLDLEFLWRKDAGKLRKGVLAKTLTKEQNGAIDDLSAAMKRLAEGTTTDYDSIAIQIGDTIYGRHKDKFDYIPWRKPGIKDKHKVGSRILADLEKQGLIKTGPAIRTRNAAIDINTGRPDPGGFKEVRVREIEIVDPELARLQAVNRELYVGRRIGLVNERDRLHLARDNKGKISLNYKDKFGRKTSEKAITKSASSKLNDVEDALERHLDQDFLNQLEYANKQKWTIDEEFISFMEDVRGYSPRVARGQTATPNLFKDLIAKRGQQGEMLFQTMKWHRQNKTEWTNLHQWDGRGRFYEQGYMAATRGEMTRPFLASPDPRSVSPRGVQELKWQMGATLGDKHKRLFKGVDAKLSQEGREASFDSWFDDILELGHIAQGRKKQFGANMEDFLKNHIIAHIDDIDDAVEIPKVTRYSLEVKRIEDHLNAGGFSMRSTQYWKQRHKTLRNFEDPDVAEAARKHLAKYKTRLLVENDASASGAQQIALAAKDKLLAEKSNVVPTQKKQRLYDLAAMETMADSRIQKRFIDELGLDVDWEDLVKGAKAQNMVTFYGAGDATKTANIEGKFAKVLAKGEDQVVVFRDKKSVNQPNTFSVRELTATIDRSINDAEGAGLTAVAESYREAKAELNRMFRGESAIGTKLLKYADEADDEVADFVKKAVNTRAGIIGPKDFELLNTVMTEKVAAMAPSTDNFIRFWKDAAKSYVPAAGNVEIQWVNYRGKQLTQVYRPIVEESIDFFDPVTGRRVSNIYRGNAEDGLLRSSSAAGDVSTGLGVNGNHMNDGSLVQAFWLDARRTNKRVATIHDGFYHHLEDADWTIDTLYKRMADGLESRTIEKTLRAMRDAGLENTNRASRRERAKLIDKLIEKLKTRDLTKDDINNAFTILPGLKERVLLQTKLDARQLSRQLGYYSKNGQINELIENIDDGFYSVKKLNDALKAIPQFERAMTAEFGFGSQRLISEFAKHGQRRRLIKDREKFDAGEIEEGFFFDKWFKEPALTPQEAGKYSLAKKAAKKAGEPVPSVSKALGKKPSPQEVLRTRYGVNTPAELQRAVRDGDFTFDNFFNTELALTEGALDTQRVKAVLRETLKSNAPDLDYDDITKAFTSYRRNLRSQDAAQRRNINNWYESMLNRARELQLVDKNKTNKKLLTSLDDVQSKVTANKFKTPQLREFYDEWGNDLEQYFGISNLAQLNRDFNSGTFKIQDFLDTQNSRYRELTRQDMLRILKPGEDRYGIGP